MPAGSAAVKRAAVAAYGGRIVDCPPTPTGRQEALRQVVADTGAVEIHPYDDPAVIAGAGTAALELVQEVPDLDAVVTPVGGGGLLSGTAVAVRASGRGPAVIGAEPVAVDDAYRSLAAGSLQEAHATATVADGLRAPLSPRTFALIQAHVHQIVPVPEADIVAAMRFVWERLKLVVEASAAVAVAALPSVAAGTAHRPARIGVILSGGNVDLDRLPWRGA
jgi:threonine dehydratase